jgi:hypothetical protein
MVLFAGLLCSVGESYACETVRRSQKLDAGDDFGRWYRSPRRMETGNDADQDGRTNENEPEGTGLDGDGRANEGEWHTFSYDMALGVMLYLVATSDKESGQRWWDWLHSYTPCITGNKPECLTLLAASPAFLDTLLPATPGSARRPPRSRSGKLARNRHAPCARHDSRPRLRKARVWVLSSDRTTPSWRRWAGILACKHPRDVSPMSSQR